MIALPVEFVSRANRPLNLHDFSSNSKPILINVPVRKPIKDRQYILRMMVQSADLPLSIPSELEWIGPTVLTLKEIQNRNGLNNPFIYITVRHGLVTSTTDDLWHVDGFSTRVPHVPEQNYIYSDCYPTEWLTNSWSIPETFDPFRHNIHSFFQEREHLGKFSTGNPEEIYLADPYCVHRRPKIPPGTTRTMWRISFIPIEIEDNTCTQNPLFPKKIYDREDIRTKLTEWKPEDEVQ